jgi:hypothetical protein
MSDHAMIAANWLPDQDSNLDWPVNNRAFYRWTIGECVGQAPKLRLPRGPDPSAPRARSDGEKGSDPANARSWSWGRFRDHLSAASTRRFHQISFPGKFPLLRPTRIELVPVQWRRTVLPLSYGRWCTEQDSNLRSPKAPDLQSGLVAT